MKSLGQIAKGGRKLAIEAVLVAVAFTPAELFGEVYQVPELRIVSESLVGTRSYTVNLNSSSIGAIAESGELLRSVPGVDAGRFGGHGLEPVIQGQQQSQLQVTTMGSYTHGACPNRMDPPSSISQSSLFDIMTVSKGYNSVTRGPGGSGGAVLFERSVPHRDFASGAGTSYQFNGDTTNSHIDISGRANNLFARGSAQFVDAGNYEDGNGDSVRSSFRQYSGIGDFGIVDDDQDYLRFSMQVGKIEDALFPGAGMDSPENELIAPRLDGAITPHSNVLDKVEFLLYATLVDHLMDNYSLRDAGAMLMRAPSTSDTIGGRVAGNFELGETALDIGVDALFLHQNAERLGGMERSNVNNLTSVLWPDLFQQDIGVFVEGERQILGGELVGGMRLDRASTEAGSTDRSYGMMKMTPQMLYQSYYGREFRTTTEYNPSGLVQYSLPLFDDAEGMVGVSYVSRHPNPTELAIASDGMSGRWVGNPGLAPERHRQLQLGATWSDEVATLSVGGYVNSVSDYIFRDVARGQSGILKDDGASVYRNISVLISGVEIIGEAPLNDKIKLVSSAYYTYGENRSDNIALAQIPPLSGKTSLKYTDQLFTLAVSSRYAASQTRVDDDPLIGSGRDLFKTSGYVLFDLDCSIAITSELRFVAGVHNVGDVKYSNHLNRSNTFEPIEVRVNEPGISAFVGINWDI